MGSLHIGRRLRRAGLAIGSAVLLLGSAGCGGEESASPGATAPAAGDAASTPQIALPTPEEPPVLGEVGWGELPEGFPEDLPLPPDSEPTNSLLIPGQLGMVTFLAPDTRGEVSAHFAETLPGQGWEVGETIQNESRTLIRASKGGRTADIIIFPSAQGSGTEIAITIGGA